MCNLISSPLQVVLGGCRITYMVHVGVCESALHQFGVTEEEMVAGEGGKGEGGGGGGGGGEGIDWSISTFVVIMVPTVQYRVTCTCGYICQHKQSKGIRANKNVCQAISLSCFGLTGSHTHPSPADLPMC